MPDNADLLNTILEDISEVINATLHEEDREGPEVGDKILKQIDEVLELREHEVASDVLLGASKRLNAFHLLYWKCILEHKTARLIKESDCDQDLLLNLILSAFMLGVYRGNRFTLDGDDYFQFMDPITHKEVSALIASSAHKEKKAIFNKKIQPVLQYAEKEWKSGSKLLHDQMSEKLLKKFPNIMDGLPSHWNLKKRLNESLKTIARKYKRVRGDKI